MAQSRSDLEILMPIVSQLGKMTKENGVAISRAEGMLLELRARLIISLNGIDDELRKWREGVYDNEFDRRRRNGNGS